MALEEAAATLLEAIHDRRPVVHHVANFVTMNDVALVTRAVGAEPIMAMSPREVEEIVRAADALVVSLGTPTAERLRAIERAVSAAHRRAIPIVIDPLGAGASTLRTAAARKTIRAAGQPVIRANPAEAAALVGEAAELRGVESAGTYDVQAIALKLVAHGGVAAITGVRDLITDGRQTLAVDNGHPWLAVLPGAGCMATAVVGTFVAVVERGGDAVAAAVGLACFGLAAETAAQHASGPGTLKPALIDALYGLTPAALRAGIRCTDLSIQHAPR